jgi:hypothetical protein
MGGNDWGGDGELDGAESDDESSRERELTTKGPEEGE